jgi:hypothetical protein
VLAVINVRSTHERVIPGGLRRRIIFRVLFMKNRRASHSAAAGMRRPIRVGHAREGPLLDREWWDDAQTLRSNVSTCVAIIASKHPRSPHSHRWHGAALGGHWRPTDRVFHPVGRTKGVSTTWSVHASIRLRIAEACDSPVISDSLSGSTLG